MQITSLLWNFVSGAYCFLVWRPRRQGTSRTDALLWEPCQNRWRLYFLEQCQSTERLHHFCHACRRGCGYRAISNRAFGDIPVNVFYALNSHCTGFLTSAFLRLGMNASEKLIDRIVLCWLLTASEIRPNSMIAILKQKGIWSSCHFKRTIKYSIYLLVSRLLRYDKMGKRRRDLEACLCAVSTRRPVWEQWKQ